MKVLFWRMKVIHCNFASSKSIKVVKMKLIINKGLDNALSKISIIKNNKEEIVYPQGQDYCELNLENDDKIVVSLRMMDSFKIKLISFSYPQEKNVLYIEPTNLCKVWELMNFKLLPYLCIMLLALKAAITSPSFGWLCAGMISLTALSLMTLQISKYLPSFRKNLFHVRWI